MSCASRSTIFMEAGNLLQIAFATVLATPLAPRLHAAARARANLVDRAEDLPPQLPSQRGAAVAVEAEVGLARLVVDHQALGRAPLQQHLARLHLHPVAEALPPVLLGVGAAGAAGQAV